MAKQGDEAVRNWYAVHTYSGYEKAVVKNIKQRIESLGMDHLIFDVVLPTEKVIKIKGKNRVEEEKTIYPGYLLVDMKVTDESWHVIRNTPRVTGFVGAGVHPVPISETEMAFLIESMREDKKADYKIDFASGDLVKIIDGPFKGTEGKIISLDPQAGQVKVSVSMFGRDTELELDYLQIQRI